jgi:hypothetical protein
MPRIILGIFVIIIRMKTYKKYILEAMIFNRNFTYLLYSVHSNTKCNIFYFIIGQSFIFIHDLTQKFRLLNHIMAKLAICYAHSLAIFSSTLEINYIFPHNHV